MIKQPIGQVMPKQPWHGLICNLNLLKTLPSGLWLSDIGVRSFYREREHGVKKVAVLLLAC